MLAQRLRSRADADCGDHLHGKEGVDGSSPSEGFHECPANRALLLSVQTQRRRLAGTRRVHFWTRGHSRARAGKSDPSTKVAAAAVLRTVADNMRPSPNGFARSAPDAAPTTIPRPSREYAARQREQRYEKQEQSISTTLFALAVRVCRTSAAWPSTCGLRAGGGCAHRS